jgi:hypothetical protein
MGTLRPHPQLEDMANNIFLPPSPVVPGMLLISAITNSNPMIVTIVDSIYNTYVVGQLVCLTVPPKYGMFQANELTAKIIAISGDNFSLNVNSTNFDAFATPAVTIPPASQPASIAPAGSKNIYETTLEPFQSLNGNQGN